MTEAVGGCWEVISDYIKLLSQPSFPFAASSSQITVFCNASVLSLAFFRTDKSLRPHTVWFCKN